MSELEKVVQSADFIVNGYSFDCDADTIRILNLNNTSKAAVLNKSGEDISMKFCAANKASWSGRKSAPSAFTLSKVLCICKQ